MKFTRLLTFTLLLLTAAFLTTAFSCSKSNVSTDTVRDRFGVKLPDPLPPTIHYTTPLGVYVEGNHPILETERPQILAAIDAGVSRTIGVTKELGWSQWQNPAQVGVMYEKAMAYSLLGDCPSLVTKDGQKIAGTVISLEPNLVIEPPTIYIAYDGAVPLSDYCRENMTNAVANELEHIEAYYNDRNWFEQTRVPGHVHPILPVPPSA